MRIAVADERVRVAGMLGELCRRNVAHLGEIEAAR
jgi:hypothetical protein